MARFKVVVSDQVFPTVDLERELLRGIDAAAADVREHGMPPPPDALRDAHHHGSRGLGRGEGYVYPHSDPAGFDVSYLPDELQGRTYYEPSGNGEEEEAE